MLRYLLFTVCFSSAPLCSAPGHHFKLGSLRTQPYLASSPLEETPQRCRKSKLFFRPGMPGMQATVLYLVVKGLSWTRSSIRQRSWGQLCPPHRSVLSPPGSPSDFFLVSCHQVFSRSTCRCGFRILFSPNQSHQIGAF